jgi:hypothetical protein
MNYLLSSGPLFWLATIITCLLIFAAVLTIWNCISADTDHDDLES